MTCATQRPMNQPMASTMAAASTRGMASNTVDSTATAGTVNESMPSCSSAAMVIGISTSTKTRVPTAALTPVEPVARDRPALSSQRSALAACSAASVTRRARVATTKPMKKIRTAPRMFGRKDMTWVRRALSGVTTWPRLSTPRAATTPNSRISQKATSPRLAPTVCLGFSLRLAFEAPGMRSTPLARAHFTALPMNQAATRIRRAPSTLGAHTSNSCSQPMNS